MARVLGSVTDLITRYDKARSLPYVEGWSESKAIDDGYVPKLWVRDEYAPKHIIIIQHITYTHHHHHRPLLLESIVALGQQGVVTLHCSYTNNEQQSSVESIYY